MKSYERAEFAVHAGKSKPYGSFRTSQGVNFAIYSHLATEVTLCLFYFEDRRLFQKIRLDPEVNKTGYVWHIHIENLPDRLCYAYHFKKGKGKVYNEYFDSDRLIIDPYAKGLATPIGWGQGIGSQPLGLVDESLDFDWEGDRPLNLSPENMVINEMHVRGFTCHPSSGSRYPGKFLGLIEKIPYLKDLGINAVKLMPIHEFNELEYSKSNPFTGEKLCNYWGYSPLHYFSPMNRYASTADFGQAVLDFKAMVKAFHRHGIEVILDVVLNHTGENEQAIFSFLGIDPSTYYLFDQKHRNMDFTGCGNTINSNHPIVRDFIKECLRYWVTEMHVDGFRFDLAGVMFRGGHGEPLKKPPLIDAISNDPILAATKLIAEPWDASGLYLLGHFYPEEERWREWNDAYRDEARQFLKGDKGKNRAFATRLCGSDDIFGRQRSPCSSINFITAHDGFTLRDLVSYNYKDNAANGEDNRDGHPANFSWNCGVEGETENKEVLSLRVRQMKNFHLTLLISQGIPMLMMGNEYGHTKSGNNNSWCQDNEMNWFLWDQLEERKGFYRFYKKCLDFRAKHPALRRGRYLTPEDIEWLGKGDGGEHFGADWDGDTNFLAYLLMDEVGGNHLYVAYNPSSERKTVSLPGRAADPGMEWKRLVDTSLSSPEDFCEEESAPGVGKGESSGEGRSLSVCYTLEPYSMIVFKRYSLN